MGRSYSGRRHMAERSLDHQKIEGSPINHSPYTLSVSLSLFSKSISEVVSDNQLNKIKNWVFNQILHSHAPNVPRSITAHERACRKTSTTTTKESRSLNIHQQHHPTNPPTPHQQWQTTCKPLHIRYTAPHDHAENQPQIPRSI